MSRAMVGHRAMNGLRLSMSRLSLQRRKKAGVALPNIAQIGTTTASNVAAANTVSGSTVALTAGSTVVVFGACRRTSGTLTGAGASCSNTPNPITWTQVKLSIYDDTTNPRLAAIAWIGKTAAAGITTISVTVDTNSNYTNFEALEFSGASAALPANIAPDALSATADPAPVLPSTPDPLSAVVTFTAQMGGGTPTQPTGYNKYGALNNSTGTLLSAMATLIGGAAAALPGPGWQGSGTKSLALAFELVRG